MQIRSVSPKLIIGTEEKSKIACLKHPDSRNKPPSWKITISIPRPAAFVLVNKAIFANAPRDFGDLFGV